MDILDTTYSRGMGTNYAFLPSSRDTLYDIAGSRGKEKTKDWRGPEHIWTERGEDAQTHHERDPRHLGETVS